MKTNEQLILEKLDNLIEKVKLLELEVKKSNENSVKRFLDIPIPTILKPIGGDPWGGQPHTDGPDSHWPKHILEYKIPTESEELKQLILESENKFCKKCRIDISNTMGYVCPNSDCPNGMGPTTC